jgi:hypothetical protein
MRDEHDNPLPAHGNFSLAFHPQPVLIVMKRRRNTNIMLKNNFVDKQPTYYNSNTMKSGMVMKLTIDAKSPCRLSAGHPGQAGGASGACAIESTAVHPRPSCSLNPNTVAKAYYALERRASARTGQQQPLGCCPAAGLCRAMLESDSRISERLFHSAFPEDVKQLTERIKESHNR